MPQQLTIFAAPLVTPTKVPEVDQTVAGRYLAVPTFEADDTPIGVQAAYALDCFHLQVPIKVPEDYEITVTLADDPSFVIEPDTGAAEDGDWEDRLDYNIEQLESRPFLFGRERGPQQRFVLAHHGITEAAAGMRAGYLGYMNELEAYTAALEYEQKHDACVVSVIGAVDTDTLHRSSMSQKANLKRLPDNPFSQNDPYRYEKDCEICQGCRYYTQVGKARAICDKVDFSLSLDGHSQWPATVDENGTLIRCLARTAD